MIQAYVVTEQDAHGDILRRLLPEDMVTTLAFVTHSYPAMSGVGTMLAVRRRPVALVADAHTTNELVMLEQLDLINYYLRRASRGYPFKVLMPMPELEVVFFQDRAVLERLIGERLTDREWRIARCSPRALLADVLGEPPITAARLNRLRDADIAILQQHPIIRELTVFLTTVLQEQEQTQPVAAVT